MIAFHQHVLRAVLLVLLVAPITIVGSPRIVASQDSQSVVVLGTAGLYIRQCPELSCEMTASAPLGSELTLLGDTVNDFSLVRWNHHQGWAYDLFLFGSGEDRFLQYGAHGCNRVAIIFNAGIGEAPSAEILTTLIETGTPATLFAMGWWAEAYPDYLRAMSNAGVVIGSHGDTQTFLTGASDAAIQAEVRNSADRIAAVIGQPPERYFTPYASDSDERVRRIIANEGFLPVGWSVSAGDYHRDDTEQGVYDRVMASVADGSIVELHLDGPATDQSTALALPRIIADLEAQGYDLVTIPEIILPCDAGGV